MKTNSRRKASLSLPYSVLLSVIFSVLAFTVCALIGSAFLMMTENPTGKIKIASLIIFLVSGAISGFSVSALRKNGGILCAILSAGITSILIIATGLLFSGGSTGGALFMNALCYMLVCALFSYLGGKRPTKRRR